jgi:DNA mismatch repair protein MutS
VQTLDAEAEGLTNSRITPMLRQYRGLKRRYPDALLFYRLGDFYELFEDDAEVAARELNLVLTSRRFSKKVRLPMCGVPYRNVTSYVARLLKGGHKVAIAEQMEDARRAKGLVKRDVVRIITPGTVIEEDLLPDKGQNYLAAIVGRERAWNAREHRLAREAVIPTGARFGLAVVDLSTGEFAATEVGDWPALAEELERIQPSEIVLPQGLADDERLTGRLRAERGGNRPPIRLSTVADDKATPEAARARLMAHFHVSSLESCGAEDRLLATAAAGAALFYLQENQISDLAHLRALTTYSLADYVSLDATTRRNLELTRTLREGRSEGSLLHALDHTETAMGARLLRRWIHQPLLDADRIRARLDAVEELVAPLGPGEEGLGAPGKRCPFLRTDLRKLLDGMYDVERLVGRVGFGNANARDLVALHRSLVRIPRIKALLAEAHSDRLCTLDRDLDELADVAESIASALVESPPILLREGGLIRRGYHAGLDTLRDAAAEGRDWVAAFEAAERERLDIPNLRIKYNQVFGFFIEVTKSHLGKVPPEYERRATVRSAERFVTPQLKAREAEILAGEDRADDLEYDLFVELRREVGAESDRLLAAARVLAELDVLAALAEVAARYGYVRPHVDDEDVIDIHEGRHPVVERARLGEGSFAYAQDKPFASAQDRPFVPNDTRLSSDERLMIITGPNMAGKSVLVRQVALIVLMAQVGSFVPACSAHIGLADRIFTRVGATDDIARGRSTFLVEMSETARILAEATPRSLVILDEVGRGTSTYDGMSLAWAVATDLHDRVGARTLFATHYHELTALSDHLPAARNYNLAVTEVDGDGSSNRVIFLHRLVPGAADRSYGLHVARLAGIPASVVAHAEEVMARLEEGDRESGIQDPGLARTGIRAAKEVREVGDGLLVTTDDEAVWQVLRELYSLDIANLTPVQALVALNEWQGRLRRAE